MENQAKLRLAKPRLNQSTPLRRIRTGALVLATTFVLAVIAFRIVGDYDWLHSIWMVVITISSVGYGETSQKSPAFQLVSIAVILVGISAAAYTLGGFIQMVLEGEIEKALGHRRWQRDLNRMQGHTIICGYGRIGRVLAADLAAIHRPFVIVEQDPDRVALANECHHHCLHADATEDAVLERAGLQRAHHLVVGLPSDADNVFVTLTARSQCPSLRIIARAEQPSTERKLRLAGADSVVAPALTGARQMIRQITRPSTAQLMEMVAETAMADVELDELPIPPGDVGKTIRQIEAIQSSHLILVAVKPADGALVFNPRADRTIEAGDLLVVMGHGRDIDQMRLGEGDTPPPAAS